MSNERRMRFEVLLTDAHIGIGNRTLGEGVHYAETPEEEAEVRRMAEHTHDLDGEKIPRYVKILSDSGKVQPTSETGKVDNAERGRIMATLKGANLTLADLKDKTDEELRKIKGIGAATLPSLKLLIAEGEAPKGDDKPEGDDSKPED